MELRQRAVATLQEAEGKLAALATTACQAREYDLGGTLLDLAKRVKALADSVAPSTRAEEVPSTESSMATAVLSAADESTLRRKGVSKKNLYPLFFKDGNILVKVAWSKSERAEYEHKSPKRVLDALVPAIVRVSAGGHRFTMDKVLPLTDPNDPSSELPDYQCYLCLAWLRAIALVQQHGRKGYTLTTREPLDSIVEAQWLSLPNK